MCSIMDGALNLLLHDCLGSSEVYLAKKGSLPIGLAYCTLAIALVEIKSHRYRIE